MFTRFRRIGGGKKEDAAAALRAAAAQFGRGLEANSNRQFVASFQ
jgi:hypothetical protein